MITVEDIPNIIPELIKKLNELPDGSIVSTASLLRDAGCKEEDWLPVAMDIHWKLHQAAREEHIRLDYTRRGRKSLGPIYEGEFRLSRSVKEEKPSFESEFKRFLSMDEEEEKKISPLIDPVEYFKRYLEIIFANDELWEQFQLYVREVMPDKEEDFFAYRRDPECIDIWRQMIDKMGDGFPINYFAAAASFLLLAFRYQGHDINRELLKACEKLKGE